MSLSSNPRMIHYLFCCLLYTNFSVLTTFALSFRSDINFFLFVYVVIILYSVFMCILS